MAKPAPENDAITPLSSEPNSAVVADKETSRQRLSSTSFWGDIKAAVVLALVLFLFLLGMHFYVASTATPDRVAKTHSFSYLYPQFLALALCFLSNFVGRIAISERFEAENPVASVLGGMLVRLIFLLGGVAFSAATKWTAHNLFASTLVGCYFSFLALESSLALRRTSTRSRF